MQKNLICIILRSLVITHKKLHRPIDKHTWHTHTHDMHLVSAPEEGRRMRTLSTCESEWARMLFLLLLIILPVFLGGEGGRGVRQIETSWKEKQQQFWENKCCVLLFSREDRKEKKSIFIWEIVEDKSANPPKSGVGLPKNKCASYFFFG